MSRPLIRSAGPRGSAVPYLAVAVAAIAILLTVSIDVAYVIAPTVVTLVVAVAALRTIARRMHGAPIDDIGAFHILTVVLYAAYPAITHAMRGLEFGRYNDNRLLVLQPTAAEFGAVGWYYSLYLLSFAVAYLLTRTDKSGVDAHRQRKSWFSILAVGMLYLVVNAFLVYLRSVYGINAEEYAETYVLVWQLPLIVRQVLKLVLGLRFVLLLLILVWTFANFRKRRWLFYAMLCMELTILLTELGQRTAFMLLIAASAVLFHVFVRRISSLAALTGAVATLGLFLLVGEVRGKESLRGDEGGLLDHNTEFEALYANAVDLELRKQADDLGDVPNALYYYDILSAIPSQVLPLEKVDPGNWYVSEFYPEGKAAGAGYGFGVVPQAIVGRGLLDIVVRGVLVGIVFGMLYRLYLRRRDEWWVIVLYVWIYVLSYQAIRASSFYLLGPLCQVLLPSLLIVKIGSAMFRGASIPQRRTLSESRASP